MNKFENSLFWEVFNDDILKTEMKLWMLTVRKHFTIKLFKPIKKQYSQIHPSIY